MVRKTPKTELPAEHQFSLSHILSRLPTGSQDLQNVNDSINTTVAAYTNDITEQLSSLANVENELLQKLQRVNDVYDVVHNIRVENVGNPQPLEADDGTIDSKKKKSKGMKIGLNNRLQQYNKIDSGFVELLDETVVQKKRINSLLTRLKTLEKNFSRRERLFDEKSPNKKHYAKLYNYAMKEKAQQQNSPEIKTDDKKNPQENESAPATKQTQPQTGNKLDPSKTMHRSNSLAHSEISQKKLNQYLDIENELEEIQKVQSHKLADIEREKVFNPVALVSKKTATCKVYD
ncbi:hypothetical protein PICMEDRAFT_11406 [Pichia membranifaciens NRRL Y-2026]|uniref:Uncharacterized protein n=1 Tax=Pichia membranifaciens NRRL Y-2026 TaxID=763406 RepID=A0A1E3NJT4_9ASCO|nr:hypothetical protein PICMEDRAFT_11406 [Pichia membranifaciens NRRL Y-2026]ODQ46405.1 hypothetical protein PICMEDRAFT_11406 [Pichia membranifaciens NRRL Y-2026]